MDRDAFDRNVRDALGRLYDTVYLQSHPLTALYCAELPPGAVGTAQVLRRTLLDAIEYLRPAEQVPYTGREWRPYRVLLHRHVQRMSALDTQQELALSERQLQREHARALACLADLLWSRLETSAGGDAALSAPRDQVDEELSSLLSGARQEALDLGEILGGALDAVLKMAEAHQVSLDLVPAPRLELVYGDRGVLRQILLNLLSFLISRSEGGRIRISAGREPAGMVLRFVHEPAERPSQPWAAEPPAPRLDLGKRLAQAMGGRLESSGDTMALHLPSHRRVVLVVDDNQDVIELIERYLGDDRYAVVGAQTGQRAIELATEAAPTLILLDVMMPAQDGWEVLQTLKHSPDTMHIPVIICSVLNEPELALSLGADGFLKKPVTQTALLELLAAQAGAGDPRRS